MSLIALLSVVAVVVVVLIGSVVIIYNRLITLRSRVDNAWAQIDVQLRRRYDLIPNLIESVKGYAAHEQSTLQQLTEARSAAINAQSIKEQGDAENAITASLKSVFAVAEQYPDLKANQNFLMLQEELSGTESKIAYARQFYNDSVMSMNMAIQQFPSSIIAGLFGFTPRDYFEVEDAAKQPVKVKF